MKKIIQKNPNKVFLFFHMSKSTFTYTTTFKNYKLIFKGVTSCTLFLKNQFMNQIDSVNVFV